MPLNGDPVVIADLTGAITINTFSRPMRTDDRGLGSQRVGAGKRAQLRVTRAANDATYAALASTIRIMGMDLPHPYATQPVAGPFGQIQTATQAQSVRPQDDQIIGDGSTLAFTTNIDTNSTDVTAYLGGVSTGGVNGMLAVEYPLFRLTGVSAAAITGTVVNGVITTSAAYDTALNPILGPFDTLLVYPSGGGPAYAANVVSCSGSTITTDATSLNLGAGATIFVTTRFRRFKRVLASGAATAEEVNLTVTNNKLVVTWATGCAPPALGTTNATAVASVNIRGGGPIDVGAAYIGTPTEILATGVNMFVDTQIRSRSLMWVVHPSAQIAGTRTLVTLSHLGD